MNPTYTTPHSAQVRNAWSHTAIFATPSRRCAYAFKGTTLLEMFYSLNSFGGPQALSHTFYVIASTMTTDQKQLPVSPSSGSLSATRAFTQTTDHLHFPVCKYTV